MEVKTPIQVSIIIISYNTKDFLAACITTLYERTHDLSFETMVIDNASGDGSPEMIQQQFPQVRLIRNSCNLGYARAVNQGIREARGGYFLILNPDVEVTEGAIRELWSFMERNPRAGIAGAKLINPGGTLQASCRTFYDLRIVLLRRTLLGKVFPNSKTVRKHLMLDWDHNSERQVDWIIGACMMVRRQAYESLGGMDERFFLYLEDVDWCYRMKAHGWPVYYVPSAVMKHCHRRESAKLLPDRKLLAHLASTFRFFDKWNAVVYAMKRERWIFSLVGTIVCDLVLINLAFVAAYYSRYAVRDFFAKPLYGLGIYRGLMVFSSVVCLLSLAYSGLYRRPRRTAFVRDLVGISRALAVSSLLIIAATYLTRTITYSRLIILVFWPISTLMVTAGRGVGRAVHRKLQESFFDRRRVAVVGENRDAVDLKDRLLASYGSEYDFVGYIAPGGAAVPELKPLVGETENISSLVVEHRLNEIYVCDRRLSRGEVGRIVIAARRAGAVVKVVSEVTDILIRGALLEDIGGTPVVAFPAASLSGVRLATKRVSDVVFAAAGMVLLAALSPAVLVAQSLSHRNYAPLGAAFGRLGRVVAGRMSLAGPGQAVSGEVLKPGMIGPWLAHADLTGEEAVRLDMYYIQNWSLSYDIELMFEGLKRIGRLFRGSAQGGC